jgi:hypothetical protein
MKPTTQPTKPCKECPFSREIQPGALGGSAPEVYIGQAHGSFWLPCHMHSEFDDPNWKSNTAKPECAGTAIYRANVYGKLDTSLLVLEPDREAVFATPAEFLAHHKGITLQQAEAELRVKPPVRHMIDEMEKIRQGEGFVELREIV